MNFTLFVTALLTGISFVAVVTILAKLISPRSFNEQKEEAYECGIPTRGRSWMQFSCSTWKRCSSSLGPS